MTDVVDAYAAETGSDQLFRFTQLVGNLTTPLTRSSSESEFGVRAPVSLPVEGLGYVTLRSTSRSSPERGVVRPSRLLVVTSSVWSSTASRLRSRPSWPTRNG